MHAFDTATTTEVNVNTYTTAASLCSVIGSGSGLCKELSA